MEDHMILELFFERKEDAINEAKLKYGKRLFRSARNILNSNEDAEECVSDTLLKAWEAIPPSKPEMLGAFLAKITRNIALNKWESKTAAKRGGGEVDLLLNELEECIPCFTGPEAAYESSLVVLAINSFLGSTNKVTRAAFILRYFHGESIQGVSDRLKISESKVKSILFRTRKKLHIHLEKEGVVI